MIISQELFQKLLAAGFPETMTFADPFFTHAIPNMRRCAKLKAFSEESAVDVFDFTDSGAFNPKNVYLLISLKIFILLKDGKLYLNLKRAIVIPIIMIVCYACAIGLLWILLFHSWFIWFLCGVISFFPLRFLIYSLFLSVKFKKV